MGAMSGQDIYDNFTKHAHGTAALQDAQVAAQTMANDLPGRAAELKRLQDEMETAWIGQAGDAAQRGLGPLALEQVNVADALHTTQDLLSRQAGSFHQAANTVHPMPPEPQLQDPLTALASGQDATSMLSQVSNYNAAAQHNVDAMNTYFGASSYNTDNMPVSYGRLANNLSSVTVQPASVAAGTSAATALPSTSTARSATGQRGAEIRPPARSPHDEQPTVAPGAPTGGHDTAGSIADQGSGSTSTGVSDAPKGSGSTMKSPTGPPVGIGAGPGPGDEPLMSGQKPGADGVALPPIGGVGVGEDGGEVGRPGGMRGGRAGDVIGAEPGVGRPAPGGVRALAGEEKSLAPRDDLAPIERPEDAGAGMLPAGADRGEQDDEHQRKYDFGPGADQVFVGELPKVAPEAFGESPEQRRARHVRDAAQDES